MGARQRSLQYILWLNGCLGLCTLCTDYFLWCHLQCCALAFGRGAIIFFFGATTENLETVAHAPRAFAFGGTLVLFFCVFFLFADCVAVVSFNLKLDGNFIIPSSFNNFKFGIVKFGFPFPCSIIFFGAAFAWVIQQRSCLCGSLFGTEIFPCSFLYLKMFDISTGTVNLAPTTFVCIEKSNCRPESRLILSSVNCPFLNFFLWSCTELPNMLPSTVAKSRGTRKLPLVL
jgi:hypothetical protein